MPTSTLHNVRFAGMATCVPKRVVSNLTDCRPQIRSERERLVRNIGIETRRMSQPWQCFSDLAFDATQVLLETLQWKREEIDALIVVTQSPDYPIPATAIILQDRLGLSHATVAFDVNLGCSAYPFGINLLGSMIAAGGVKKGLLLVGDRSANLEDPIFSDSGTATALEFDQNAAPMYFDLNSDGSGYKAIILPVGGQREPVAIQHLLPYRENEKDRWHQATDLQLDGTAVLSFSTQRVPPAVEKLIAYAGVSKDDIDYFVFHQANKMINETIRKKLGLPVEKVPSTLRDFGNTSGASLPLTMTARINKELESGPNRVLLSGFGIGLSWGTCLIDIEGAVFPELIES
ncbi:ketoacyl-ACP synthase III [Xanthomonas hortorum]|uniref:3-oxoacyl-[acyl-carrier-protein] synthase 3 n=1 Tax=Xanthomonas hortorum pv. gardneri TaxID=2754056 RepID=A0A6V7D626_9XANT|nr:ketoacyl-ACP synthase III [Xanthomonas hortorum]APP80829.1 3-oxoacyl-ACP synthase [Xanthomonas hortorum pv. gardneri]EGD17401.1 3-oxoacyl-(acyl-carrier-protein) synthase III [Xanthomonas hortorum ATCC 19865]KLA93442.1 3-oxoacyl-ACP synthase [Xanthomonas hortorum pv. gardneri]KLA94428.1 3-oxoacyl-ACP synthase [Xanthomonas hortorum pv. gardneri]KLA98539.1 3-oxoacyl-ACP synthase [Xanthomonas hortorum pv. gardneri]